MTETARLHGRRRLLILASILLTALEVSGATLASVVVARTSLEQRAAAMTAAQAASSARVTTRLATSWARLGAELSIPPVAGAVARGLALADEVFDPRRPTAPPAAEAVDPNPLPAIAGDETTAAADGLAGAGRAAAVVAQRLRIPDLGINQTVGEYQCDRSDPLDNYVYRWGCAGRNNLYLLGHAYSVFRALHDAYAAGNLRVGMTAEWTDSTGRIVSYRVTTWRLVRPDQVDWAIASQPVPSMTLQTCYGANSEYRLLVRLVAGS